MNAIATTEHQNFGGLISKAVEGGNLDIVTKMMDLQDRHDKKQAKQAFDYALASFKENAPKIIKNKKGHNTLYADLPQAVAKATPILSEYGLSSRWDQSTNPKEGTVTVTCLLCHIDGHCESVSMSEMYEDSGKKNRIQSMASAVTYLQRYTFMAITGLAAGGEDDDGQASGHATYLSELQTAMACGDSLGVHLIYQGFLSINNSHPSNDTHGSSELSKQTGIGLPSGTKGKAKINADRMDLEGRQLLESITAAAIEGDYLTVAQCLENALQRSKALLKEYQPDTYALVLPLMKIFNDEVKSNLAAQRQEQEGGE